MADDGDPDAPRRDDASEDVPLSVIPLHSSNLLTVLDADGVVRYESPSIERIFGFDQDELVGERVAEYFHPDDRARVLEAFRTVVESDEYVVEAVEFRHEVADGSYRWVESVASSDPTPEGYYVVNTRDISERKRRERAMAETNERLERFASLLSHDLRSPLTVAALRLDLARESCDCSHLEDVARAHERMGTLIDDLLELTRGGDSVGELERVELAALGQRCWQTVATADATFENEAERAIRADESRLRRLLENLVRNAVEHGGDTVTITLGELADDEGFFVADDGSGIGESRRDRVFESGHSTTETGTGLGLAIVSDVAEAHGWTVRVTESSEGGARFEIAGVEFAA